MPRTRTIPLRFPLGGVARRHGYEYQPQHTTPNALNVWPAEWDNGRTRGGVRPGMATLTTGSGGASSSVGGAPYGWCEATYYSSGAKRGVAVVHAAGVSTSLDGATWTSRISTAPGTDFSSCAVYNSKVYMARGGGTCLTIALTTSGLGSAISATGDGGVGTAPTNCGIVVAAMDRIWLGGDTSNPHVLYASRVGDPTGWDYSLLDQGAAFTTSGDNGIISEPITSLIHHGSNCLIVGCIDSMHVIAGNPRAGGVRRVVNQAHGPLSQTAWCKDEGDNTWFFSRAGLYKIGSGCIADGTNIESMSRERLPASLLAVDPGAGDRVCLGYDIKHRGVHIYVDRASGTDEYWFYDVNDGGFWPMSFPSTMHLAVPLKPAMTTTKSALLAITSAGSVKQFDSSQSTDYGTAIDSYLDIGPIKLGDADNSGVMVDCFATLAEDSGNAAWTVRGGNSAQEAYAATPWFTGGNWTIQGLNHRQHPRVMGHSAFIKVEDVTGSRWSFEEIVCNVSDGGRRRVY